MKNVESKELRYEIERLSKEISYLRAENRRLNGKLKILESHPTLTKGIAGENLIGQLISAQRTERNSDHDLVVGEAKIRIEVKFANLNLAVASSTTRRWAWAKIFGESGRKEYDRLILMGDADPEWQDQYLDPNSQYIFFDLPFSEVAPLTIKTGRNLSIQLSSNPRTARSSSASLFTKYQVTLSTLEQRYAL